MHDVLDSAAATLAIAGELGTTAAGRPRPAAPRRPSPTATDLRQALRPDARERHPVDPGLAGGLRAWLEDGVAPHVAHRPTCAGPVVIGRWSLAECSGTRTGPGAQGHGPPTVTAVRQAMVDRLFRQLTTTGAIGRPFADAVAGLRADDRGSAMVRFVSELPRASRHALRREVEAHGLAMAAGWPALPPAWLPRTTERMWVPLAGGRVVLRATAALALGPPAGHRASVCLVDVRADGPRPIHAVERRFLALVETLRAGAPPCRVATYYPASGVLADDNPSDAALASMVMAVTDAVEHRVAAEARHP